MTMTRRTFLGSSVASLTYSMTNPSFTQTRPTPVQRGQQVAAIYRTKIGEIEVHPGVRRVLSHIRKQKYLGGSRPAQIAGHQYAAQCRGSRNEHHDRGKEQDQSDPRRE
jgi:hypothetical protein